MADGSALGSHRYWIKDDLVHLETVGDFSAEEMRALNRLHHEVGQRHGYVLFFIDNREPGMLSAEARRVAVDNNREQNRPPWSMALTGFEGARGVMARGAVTLAASGIQLITGKRIPLRFFSTPDGALRWLGEERQRHRSAAPGS